MKCSKRLFPILVLVAAHMTPMMAVSQVYKVEGPDGPIFTTEKPTENAKPADLPPINRGEVAVPKVDLITCEEYGGIDCEAGPDTDGSVICFSGFTGASNRFRFSCNMPKLEITEITPFDEEGKFSVFVRNSKSVAAQNPQVVFEAPSGKQEYLAGPKEIGAFGLEEYIFQSQNRDDFVPNEQVTIAQLTLSCLNCP